MQDGVNRLPDSKEPKKVGWTDKPCILCKMHVEPFKINKTHDCHHFNKDGTPIKNHEGASKSQPIKKGPEGANFVQLMHTKIKKALCKHICKEKKHSMCEAHSDSNSNDST